jgi:flagellin
VTGHRPLSHPWDSKRQLAVNQSNASKSMERLSSGMRINRAGDDAAGLAISEKMRGQIRGLKQAQRNAQDGISMIQTAEGALNETHAILQRMRELATQSANDTNIEVDRGEIQKEVDQLAQEITRIANNTEFNQQTLLNGGISEGGIGRVRFHIGANAGQNIELEINAMDAKTLGVSRDITEQATGTLASTANTAIASVSFAEEVGVGVVDGATIDFTYTAGQAATQSELNGSVALGTDVTNGGDTVMTITVGSTDFTVSLAEWDGTGDGTALASLIASAVDGDGNTLDSVANVNVSEAMGTLSITLVDAGATELSVSYSGTDAADAATLTGIANAATNTGDAFKASTLTITNGTYTQYIEVGDGTGDSLTVSTGPFAGMTIGTGTKSIADIHADDEITVAAQTTESTSATFEGGALVNEAVAAAGINVSTQSAASSAITTIQNAIETVSAERSKLGSYQNRLEHTISNLGTSAENLQAAESRIRDLDMAEEIMAFTKNNILQQAATAMLAQANMAPQSVLQLLG